MHYTLQHIEQGGTLRLYALCCRTLRLLAVDAVQQSSNTHGVVIATALQEMHCAHQVAHQRTGILWEVQHFSLFLMRMLSQLAQSLS